MKTDDRNERRICAGGEHLKRRFASLFASLRLNKQFQREERVDVKMRRIKDDEVRRHVRDHYKQLAIQQTVAGSCCAPGSCCAGSNTDVDRISSQLGYSQEELAQAPDGANLGLGCGNPLAIASLQPGQVVLDLGCGGGFDCFLAARQVGEHGKVIGVDMTPEMISRARHHAAQGGFANTEFRLGEIEHLPVANASVDVVISNCVINLSPDKQQVFAEAYRVLKTGGRLAVTDIVTTALLPDSIQQDLALYAGCIAGASSIEELQVMLVDSGFCDVSIQPKEASRTFIREWAPGANIDEYVVSAVISANKYKS